MECVPLSALHIGQHKQCIQVRASRVYHHRAGSDDGNIKEIRMVLIDEKGDSTYAIVPDNLVDRNIHMLHESAVYELESFQVSSRQDVMSPVESPLVIMFTELTTIQLVLRPIDSFPEWTYSLTSFTDLPSAGAYPRTYIDVIGVIRGISNVATLNINGRTTPASRRHIILADESGNKMRITLWGEAAFKFNGRVIRHLGRTESAVVIFVGTTVHTYEGSKELAGAAACRWYINEDTEDINILRVSFQSSFEPIAQLSAPRQMNLQPLLNIHCPVTPLSQLLNPGLFENLNGTFRCIIKVWRLTPGQQWWMARCAQCGHPAQPVLSSSMEPENYRCSDITCACMDASLEYHLRLLGSDETGEAEFSLFGAVAENIISVSPQQTILNNCPGATPVVNLAVAAARIMHTPPELAAVVSCKYKFIISVTANSFHGAWASFSVRAVEACYPAE